MRSLTTSTYPRFVTGSGSRWIIVAGMGGDDEKKPAPTPMSRTATLDDPLTTQVLAEVARRAQTMELDPQALRRLVHEEPFEDEDTTAENPHPHLRKRR
jgi:hypothetical protein